MIWALFFLGVGLLVGGFVGSYIGGPGAGALGTGLGVPLATISLVLWFLSKTFQEINSDNRAVAQAAVQAGRVGMARVEQIQTTGSLINDHPLFEIELTVQPRHGQPYRTRFRRVLNYQKHVVLVPGEVHPVAILAEGEPDVSFLDPEELTDPSLLKLPVPSASSAGELLSPAKGKLRLNGKRTKPLIGTSKRWLPLRAVLYLVMICAGIVLVLLPMRGAVELSFETKKITGSWIADMRTEPGVSAALEALEQEVGHDRVVSVSLHKNFVLIDAPVGPDTLNTDSWQYRGGKLTNNGPAPTQPESEDEFFRISDVRWDAYWPAVQSVTSGLGEEATDEIGIGAERETNSDVDSDSFARSTGNVIARFTVDEPYSSTAYIMDSQGQNVTEY